MRDAVRELFANPPPGSKLQAAIDFGVDISLMDPPQYSDHVGVALVEEAPLHGAVVFGAAFRPPSSRALSGIASMELLGA
jgi:hypothetical protein